MRLSTMYLLCFLLLCRIFVCYCCCLASESLMIIHLVLFLSLYVSPSFCFPSEKENRTKTTFQLIQIHQIKDHIAEKRFEIKKWMKWIPFETDQTNHMISSLYQCGSIYWLFNTNWEKIASKGKRNRQKMRSDFLDLKMIIKFIW